MAAESQMEARKIPVGISECLLGMAVRYDGGHKFSRVCAEVLSQYFEFVPFCPEIAIGLGVPRQPIRLVGDFDAPRAVGVGGASLDVTEELRGYASMLADRLQPLCGYIFMERSPSCGVFSAKVYSVGGIHAERRAGLFSAEVIDAHPFLPVEEGGRLEDARIRENFVARVYLYHEWREQIEPQPSPARLVAFHSRHKYALMAHSQALYRRLGQLVANCGRDNIDFCYESYLSCLMQGTSSPPTRKGHANALYHLVGYLKRDLPGSVRQELINSIEDYRKDVVPLSVPISLVRQYIFSCASDYAKSQSYLDPYPNALDLRSAI